MYYLAPRTNDRARAYLERLASLLVAHAQTDQGPIDASLGPLNPMVLPFTREGSFSLELALKLAHADEDRLVIQHLSAAGYHLRFYAAKCQSPDASWNVLKLMVGYSAFQHSLPLTETHCETPDHSGDLVLPSVIALALTASLVSHAANATCPRRP